MAKAESKIEKVLAGNGTKRIGGLVYWSLERVDIAREEFVDELKRIDLEGAVGKPPTAKALLSRAVRQVMHGRKGLFARHHGSGYAIVLESGANQLTHKHLLTVTTREMADCDVLVVSRMSETADEDLGQSNNSNLIPLLEAAWKRGQTHMDTSELGSTLVTLMQGAGRRLLLGAIPLREKGGLYFVPDKHVDQALTLSALLAKLTPESRLSVLAISGDGENLQQAADAAARGFSGQLAELRQEVTTFKAKLKAEGKECGERSLGARIERFHALAQRVELFRDVLGNVASELEGEIKQVREAVARDLA